MQANLLTAIYTGGSKQDKHAVVVDYAFWQYW